MVLGREALWSSKFKSSEPTSSHSLFVFLVLSLVGMHMHTLCTCHTHTHTYTHTHTHTHPYTHTHQARRPLCGAVIHVLAMVTPTGLVCGVQAYIGAPGQETSLWGSNPCARHGYTHEFGLLSSSIHWSPRPELRSFCGAVIHVLAMVTPTNFGLWNSSSRVQSPPPPIHHFSPFVILSGWYPHAHITCVHAHMQTHWISVLFSTPILMRFH